MSSQAKSSPFETHNNERLLLSCFDAHSGNSGLDLMSEKVLRECSRNRGNSPYLEGAVSLAISSRPWSLRAPSLALRNLTRTERGERDARKLTSEGVSATSGAGVRGRSSSQAMCSSSTWKKKPRTSVLLEIGGARRKEPCLKDSSGQRKPSKPTSNRRHESASARISNGCLSGRGLLFRVRPLPGSSRSAREC